MVIFCTNGGISQSPGSRLLFLAIYKLKDFGLVLAGHGLAVVPVHDLEAVDISLPELSPVCRIRKKKGRVTYQRPHQILLALLEALQGVLVVAGALDDDRGLALADVVEDGLDLPLGGRILGDVELKLLAARLGGVIAGLVDGRAGLSVGGSLLQDIGDADGRGRARLVEEGDDVEAFRLPEVKGERALAAVVRSSRVGRVGGCGKLRRGRLVRPVGAHVVRNC